MDYKCRVCNKEFGEDRDALFEHLHKAHPIIKPKRQGDVVVTKCPDCDYRAISKRYTDCIDLLNEHVKSMH